MAKTSLSIGVDIGGTKIAFGLVDAKGNLFEHELQKTDPSHNVQAIEKQVIAGIRSLQKKTKKKISHVGVGIAGQVNPKTGVVYFAPNLKWDQVPLKKNLEKSVKLPVNIIDDVRAATWAEWHFGAGRDCDDFVCLFVGTGIGGGIVSNGHLLTGHSNCAGELGHMTILMNGPLCTCGNKGCLEALAGGWAIAKRAQQGISKDYKTGKFLLEIAKEKKNVTAQTVVEAFYAGDPFSKRLMDEITEALTAGVVSIVNAFNPQRVILSGGVILGVPDLVDGIVEGVEQYALKAATKDLEIVLAELQNNAGVIGAATFQDKHAKR